MRPVRNTNEKAINKKEKLCCNGSSIQQTAISYIPQTRRNRNCNHHHRQSGYWRLCQSRNVGQHQRNQHEQFRKYSTNLLQPGTSNHHFQKFCHYLLAHPEPTPKRGLLSPLASGRYARQNQYYSAPGIQQVFALLDRLR